LIESGPAGGAIFAASVAARAGEAQVLAFDMGGTTAKVCLIRNSKPDSGRTYEVDRAARFQKGSGLPLRIPVIDLVEIGAGGGSIATVNNLKSITVGPRSAGSDPGPACYGLGGLRPTVTDADCALGLIDPQNFAGGSIKLDAAAAQSALSADVGEILGFTPEVAAYAVYEMVCENMASAARVHAIEKGRSLAGYTLIAFGGASPLHAARVAEKIGVSRVLVPPNAGVGSAVGFLEAPISYEIVRSQRSVLDDFDDSSTNGLLSELEHEARSLVATGAGDAPLTTHRRSFMRYVGQGHEIAIDVPNRPLRQDDRHSLRTSFEREYAALFNRTIPGAGLEILSWSVLVTTEPSPVSAAAAADPRGSVKPVSSRSFFDGRSGEVATIPVFNRADLSPGVIVRGPALITEAETTTFVSDVFDAHIDGQDNIVLVRTQAKGAKS